MANEFPARFRGHCAGCDDTIRVGELIKRSPRTLPGGQPLFEHVLCPLTDDELARVQPVCPSCWCVHAGECA